MNNEQLERRLECWFDGELGSDAEAVQAALSQSECQAYLAWLRELREHTRAVAARPAINDAQFPAFMAGIRNKLEAPPRRHAQLWALASLTAAALIVAVSLFLMFNGAGGNGTATVVEAVETQIDGATVNAYSSDDGSATVWVTEPDEEDAWVSDTQGEIW
ncbi:MAG: hypothetical protein JXR94_05955 [Candidatus Hydrogenedentes bacterium]|nr:hypothetical protein [Candidatus Hydrogenedentota bacterium]